MKRMFTAAAASLPMLSIIPVALAQPAEPAIVQADSGLRVPAWTSPETQAVGQMLSGVWKSAAVAQADGAGSIQVVMAIAPVAIDGVPDALYVEASRADALWEPYRQAIFQVYRFKDGLRLRTYELRNDPGIRNAIVGLAYVPELMPKLTRDDLIATLDLDLTKQPGGYAGKTPYPYPTGSGGAVEMTSQIQITSDKLASSDTGFAADGSVAWGSAPGDRYEFSKVQPDVKVTRLPEGVAILSFYGGEGEPIKEGQLATVHYTGYIDDGFAFDSSRKRAQPMTFRWPGQMIPGWNLGMADLRKDERRRIIIPGELGYGERGNPQARIGPNQRLTFDLECVLLQDSPAQPQPTPSGGH